MHFHRIFLVATFAAAALLIVAAATNRMSREAVLALDVPILLLLCSAVWLVYLARSRRQALQQSERRATDAIISEAKFAGIVSIATDAILSIDANQKIVIFNDGAERIFGYRKDEAVGKSLEELIPERFRTVHHQHLERFAIGPEAARRMGERSAIFGRRASGEEFPAEAAISRIEVNGERLMTVVLRDVTLRRRDERREQILADAGSLLASSLDFEETIAKVAALACKSLAGWCLVTLSKDEGRPARTKVAPPQAEERELAEELQKIQLSGRWSFLQDALTQMKPVTIGSLDSSDALKLPCTEQEGKLLKALNGASLTAVPLVARGKHIGTLSMICAPTTNSVVDLALLERIAHLAALALDNARLYQEAKAATKARDDILGIVAHDLRSPLNGIMLNLQVVEGKLNKLGAEDLNREWLSRCKSGAHTMNRLIQDLLDISRLEAGRLTLKPFLCTTRRLVEQAFAHARTVAQEVVVEILCGDPLPDVCADEARIMQVFSNLIDNALKFTPPGGSVVIGANVEGQDLKFWIRDTGPGIPPDKLAQIFDRFWQTDFTNRRGAGLGLSIAKTIVELHGGRLWAQSAEDVGTTFFFTLPAAEGTL